MKKPTATKPIQQVAKIISVFNQKGGCGKTMLSMQLGGTLALRGYRVLIVDMDRQATAQIWSVQGLRQDTYFPAKVEQMASIKERVVHQIERDLPNYDVILVDCPPAIDSPIPWATLNIADMAIIPVMPTLDNVWASKEAKELALKAKNEGNRELSIYFLPSNVKANNVTKASLKALQGDNTVPILKSQLSSRSAFPESQFHGSTVHKIGKSSPATKEIERLADEILGLLGIEMKEAT